MNEQGSTNYEGRIAGNRKSIISYILTYSRPNKVNPLIALDSKFLCLLLSTDPSRKKGVCMCVFGGWSGELGGGGKGAERKTRKRQCITYPGQKGDVEDILH